jgi:hypothetical protein
VAEKIRNQEPDWEAIPKEYNEGLETIIMQMLSKDPSKRPEAIDLIHFCETAFKMLRCSELPKFPSESDEVALASTNCIEVPDYELGEDGTMCYDRDTEFDIAPLHFT